MKKNDFEQASDFLLLVAPASIGRSREHNISALKRKLDRLEGRQGSDGKQGGGKVRYYSKREWWKLSQEERDEISAKRRLLRNKNGKSDKNEKDTKIAALMEALEEQKQVIASMMSKKEETPLPPKTTKDPLKPPSGFTQRE